jgi:hypothetical protein
MDVRDPQGGPSVLVSVQPLSSKNQLRPPEPNLDEDFEDISADEAATPRGDTKEEENHFGFMIRPGDDQIHYDPATDAKKTREREQKWLKMLSNWKDWSENKSVKLKERCRKGIPDSLRGKVWLLLCGANELLEQNPNLFDELISRPDNDVVIHIIDKDLGRTFPSHVLFAKKGSQGQQDLRLVLKAYAMYNEKTGYCQAMAPVAATLLMHMPAEVSLLL